jgi:hypothetical protein
MSWCSLNLFLSKFDQSYKLIVWILLHLALANQRIPSTPTTLFPNSIFIYINRSSQEWSTETWRDGAFPRFQSDYSLRYFWLTQPQIFYAIEGCSGEILASHVPNLIIVWLRYCFCDIAFIAFFYYVNT